MGRHVGAPVPEDDWERVQALRSLSLLDTPEEDSFSRITDCCAQVFGVPIALVSLVDTDRQWFKAKCGLSACQTSRDLAFCAHAILQRESRVFLVEDATQDERFKYSDLVLGPPHIRFYAGAPLEYENDEQVVHKIGTLCIIDTVPRKLSQEHQDLLMTLARLVVAEIKLRNNLLAERKEVHEQAQEGAAVKARDMNTQYIGQVAHDLRTPLNSFQLGLQALSTTELSDEQRDLVATMDVSVQLMNLTCTKALDQSQLAHGLDLKAVRKAFNIVEMLEKSQVVVMGYTHESKEVQYECLMDEGVSTNVISDEDFLWQMYMNILCNARKFTTSGYIRTQVSLVQDADTATIIDEDRMAGTGSVRMDFSGEGTQAYLRIAVADTGIGVREDQVHALFKPFGQLQEFSGGTGLGLFSLSEKAKTLRGRCGMYPNRPKGSVFWFEVPYTPASDEQVLSHGPWPGISEEMCRRPSRVRVGGRPEGGDSADEVEEDGDDDLEWLSQRVISRKQMDPSNAKPGSFRARASGGRSGAGSPSRVSYRSIQSAASTVHNLSTESIETVSTLADAHSLSTESISGVSAHNVSSESVTSSKPGRTPSAKSVCRGALDILVIEDDVPTRALMVHGLKKKGYNVQQAGNGEEGLHLMRSRLFHMVLSDIMMPFMDGLECVKRLREWEKETGRTPQYICALSANSAPVDVDKTLQAGFNHFFPKPANLKQIIRELQGKFMVLPHEPDDG